MPFSCHLCPKRFNRSYTLKNHMKLHSAGSLPAKFQVASWPRHPLPQDDPTSTELLVPMLPAPMLPAGGLGQPFH